MRSDEASWTARRVAAQRLGFRRAPARSGWPDDDQRLQADVAAGIDDGDHGLRRYLAARTAFVDRAVVAALDAGVPQVVLAGAGYDGRALRYARTGVTWFEVDHPATQADKRSRLERLGIATGGVTFVPVEVGVHDVPATALALAGHDAEAPSLVVCEGLAPYLPPEVLTGLLAGLAARAGAGSELAIEVPLEPRTDGGRERRANLSRAVAGAGEPIRSAVPAAEVATMLESCGWSVRRARSPRGEPVATSTSSVAFVLARPV